MSFKISGLAGVLASPRFTILNFSLLLLSTLLIKPLKIETLGFISLAVAMMFVNLLFCLLKRRFSSGALTVFHIALLFFIASLGLSSLFYFYGYIELAEGQRDGIQRFVKGVLHENRLDGAVFTQRRVDINYTGTDLSGFKSSLSFKSPAGRKIPVTIQFLNSFEWKGYDFYLHRDRGYAVELEFKDRFNTKRGFVDLPDYIRNPEGQAKYFDIPGEDLGFVASLEISDKRHFTGEWTMDIPQKATLTIERGGEEYRLLEGETVYLNGGGTIRFLRVTRWVNYVVYKNSFGSFMALSGGAAFSALLFHLLKGTLKRRGSNVALWKRLS